MFFGIEEYSKSKFSKWEVHGITFQSVKEKIKGLEPDIGTTNTIVASLCNEALKITTLIYPEMKDTLNYKAENGIYTNTFQSPMKGDCICCMQIAKVFFPISKDQTLLDLLSRLQETKLFQAKINQQLGKKFSISGDETYYSSLLDVLEKTLKDNLSKKLEELMKDEEEICVFSKNWDKSYSFYVKFE